MSSGIPEGPQRRNLAGSIRDGRSPIRNLTTIPLASLRSLARSVITDPAKISGLLRRLIEAGGHLHGGIDNHSLRRTAKLIRFDSEGLILLTRDFRESDSSQVFLSFEVDGSTYMFAALKSFSLSGQDVIVPVPESIFSVERRDLPRERASARDGDPDRVELSALNQIPVRARVSDWSYQGLGVELPEREFNADSEQVSVRFLDGHRAGEELNGEIRNRVEGGRGQGWIRLGLSVSRASRSQLIPVERDRVSLSAGAARESLRLLKSRVRIAARRALQRFGGEKVETSEVPIVEYPNARGEIIRGIADTFGDSRGAPAVIIPPAWGRTKETVWPLAATIIETFRHAGEPVSVIRYDGIRRRGESHIDPDCRTPGKENHRFTFSQGAEDVSATVDFLNRDKRFLPSSIVMVTLSAAAVEGRRALATDASQRIGGWVSVVGMADPQSALRTISGGVDFVYGLQRGMTFGLQEILGVVVDIDRVGLDGIAKNLVHLEDARRDMERIAIPVTWIHAKYDAWVDLGRVRDILSCGDTSRRRLIEVPTGHQLRTSREALRTFQLVAGEVSRMALGRTLPSQVPDPIKLEARRKAERSRIAHSQIDIGQFWRDYLLGRDGKIGIDLVTATDSYRAFLLEQAAKLRIEPGQSIADLGSGTGTFLRCLLENALAPRDIRVHAFDLVPGALARSRAVTNAGVVSAAIHASYVASDLNLRGRLSIPVGSECYDAVLASLLVSYVGDPSVFIDEVYRILRPGGRLVISSMRRDGDISKLYVDSVQEMHAGRAREAFGEEIAEDFDRLSRPFVNDAARLLEMEEAGRFRFWDPGELCDLVERGGFKGVEHSMSLGDPPQAVIVSGTKA